MSNFYRGVPRSTWRTVDTQNHVVLPRDTFNEFINEVAELERGFASLDYERACEFGDPNRDSIDLEATPLADRLRAASEDR